MMRLVEIRLLFFMMRLLRLCRFRCDDEMISYTKAVFLTQWNSQQLPAQIFYNLNF